MSISLMKLIMIIRMARTDMTSTRFVLRDGKKFTTSAPIRTNNASRKIIILGGQYALLV
jgi:hypothetical protein